MPIKIAKDDNFPVRISSSLGGDLLVESLSGEDRLGRPFEYHLNLLSQNHQLEFDKVVGQKVAVSVQLAKGVRWFHGFITDFSYAPPRDTYARYEATIRPWFWFLTQTADCRIFQEMKVPDIIKKVFGDNGMKDYEVKLSGTYRVWEYCVQYCESDFNFISRLMEQEGIYYYFKHTDTEHTMVLADAPSAHATFPEYATVHYDSQPDKNQFGDNLDFWTVRQSIVPNTYTSIDFNMKTPKANMLTKSVAKSKHASPLGDPEIFNYPGEYAVAADGNENVKIRLQELQCQQEVLQMEGTCRGIASGYLFTLKDHFREDQNKEYLVVSVSHQVNNASFISGSGQAAELYRCQAEVIGSKKPFRTARRTRKPIVQGPQTAIVVGPAGEEIHTDKFGRVKVQFHWDRYGKKDAESSCWVRVSQLWAGKSWGGIQLPRITQEVIVSFMEGDPDQPIITGRVYNADFMPPYDLPDNKTQSGIKSRSSKDGGPDNFNEFRFEDKIGEEEVYIHAEKDQNNVVENDETTEVGHDRTENVENNETISIGVDRTEDVGKNETISIGENRKEDVGKNETISIGENRKEDVGKNETISIGGDRKEDVGKSETISIGDNQTEKVGKNLKLTVGDSRTTKVAKDDALDVGKKLTLVAGDQITLKTGSASISMKKDGTITIKGKNIKVQGSGKIDVKASSAITMKGSKVTQN